MTLPRSYLYVPGHRPAMLAKAVRHRLAGFTAPGRRRAGVQIISGTVGNRVTGHDINEGSFNGDFVLYVPPVA